MTDPAVPRCGPAAVRTALLDAAAEIVEERLAPSVTVREIAARGRPIGASMPMGRRRPAEPAVAEQPNASR